PPLRRWTNGPRREAAAAVRTDIVQLGGDAVGAEGAFVGADARERRGRRQVAITPFAVRPQLESHRVSSAVDAAPYTTLVAAASVWHDARASEDISPWQDWTAAWRS